MSLAGVTTPVTVTTSVTTLYTAPTSTGYYRDLVVSNSGTAVVYLTGSAATQATTQYLPLPAGQYVLLGGPAESLYGITANGTATVQVGQASVVSVT